MSRAALQTELWRAEAQTERLMGRKEFLQPAQNHNLQRADAPINPESSFRDKRGKIHCRRSINPFTEATSQLHGLFLGAFLAKEQEKFLKKLLRIFVDTENRAAALQKHHASLLLLCLYCDA